MWLLWIGNFCLVQKKKKLNNAPSALGAQHVKLHFCEKNTCHSSSKHTPRLWNAFLISWHKVFFIWKCVVSSAQDTACGKAKSLDFRKSLGNFVFFIFYCAYLIFYFIFRLQYSDCKCRHQCACFPFWVVSWYYTCCQCLR